jgi:hypothetical protein
MKNKYLRLLLLTIGFAPGVFSFDYSLSVRNMKGRQNYFESLKNTLKNSFSIKKLDITSNNLNNYPKICHAIAIGILNSVSLREIDLRQNYLKGSPECLELLVSGIANSNFIATAKFDRDTISSDETLKQMSKAGFALQADGETWYRDNRKFGYTDYFNDDAFKKN